MTTDRPPRFARAVKFYLDLLWVALLIGLVGLLIVTPVTLIALPDTEEPVKMSVLTHFVVAPDATAIQAARGYFPGQLAYGQGTLRVACDSRRAWALNLLGTFLVLGVAFYAVRHLRALLRDVLAGQPFTPRNALRIRTLGFVLVGWQVLAPILKFTVGGMIIREISVEGLVLKPPLDFRPDALFLGLAIVVLGEIFHRGARLQHDQSLTV